LLAVLVFDLLPLDGPRRWSGVGVGLAAGIKLTPLLFIPFLLITGRARAAAVATATFLATVALGFLIVPSQAHEYWLSGAFDDLSRIDPIGTTGNESLLGMLSRFGLAEGGFSFVAWVVAAVLISFVSLVIATWAYRRGYGLLAVSLCGLTSVAVSPFSWVHQWVWLVPLAVFLADRAIVLRSRVSALYVGVLWITTAAWITEWRSPASGLTPPEGLVTLDPRGWLGVVTRNSYLVLFTAALLISAGFLRRAPVAAPVPRPEWGARALRTPGLPGRVDRKSDAG
jgi:alpha-1,2-mannosyltransferase